MVICCGTWRRRGRVDGSVEKGTWRLGSFLFLRREIDEVLWRLEKLRDSVLRG